MRRRKPYTAEDFWKIRKRSDIRTEFLTDVLINAIESGNPQSWGSVRDYKWAGTWNGDKVDRAQAKIYDEEGKEHKVTADEIAKGIRVFLEKYPDSSIANEIREGNKANDGGMLDCESSDAVLQCGIFGELVYS